MVTVYGQQNVIASYYADKFHGRKTASGSIYHRDSLTCAHKTLPFGTVLKVTNPHNNKEVIVKVTDRGPFIKGRSIDLSYAAARYIGILSRGISKVQIQQLDKNYVQKEAEPTRLKNERLFENLDFLKSPMDTLKIDPDNTKVDDFNYRVASLSRHLIIKTA